MDIFWNHTIHEILACGIKGSVELQVLVPGNWSPYCGIQNPILSWIPLQMGQGSLPTLAIVEESGYK